MVITMISFMKDMFMALFPINVQGDYVMSKHVDNEVEHVESGGMGINVNKDEK